MTKDHPSDRTLKSVKTAFEILEFIQEQEGAYLTTIASHLNLPKSTTHQHLQTLEDINYLMREDGQYYLGLWFVLLGEHARTRKEAYSLAKPMVEELANDTEERAQFLVEEHGQGIYLHTDQGSQGVQTNRLIGERRYLHSSAGGKAMLAYMEESNVEQIIDEIGLPAETQNTLTTKEQLFDELESIQERGYSTNDEESITGLRGIGVPVFGPKGSIFGAFSVSGPTQRFSGEWFEEELPDLLLGTANELELRLKYL